MSDDSSYYGSVAFAISLAIAVATVWISGDLRLLLVVAVFVGFAVFAWRRWVRATSWPCRLCGTRNPGSRVLCRKCSEFRRQG